MASAVAKRLEGKTIVITGASSGIGYSTAKEFARSSPKNLKLIVTARRVDRLEQLAKEIKEEVGDGVKVLPVKLDVANPEEVKNFVPSLPAEFQDIHVLVNNAGLVKGVAQAPDINPNDINVMISTNVTGLINMTQAILPIFKKRDEGGRGDIINVGSIAGREAYPGGSIYCATKAFVRSFTDALRKELISTRIRVIEIDPGQVETEFSIVRYYGDRAKADAVYAGCEPLTPDDIAEVIVFAASRRENVVIADTLIFPSHQGSPTHLHPVNTSDSQARRSNYRRSAMDPEEQPRGDASPPRAVIKPQHRRRHDPDVTFEEYHYYALKTREEEKAAAASDGPTTTLWKTLLRGRSAGQPTQDESQNSPPPPADDQTKEVNANRLEITDEEWTNASRMMRTATAGACFYLITTDILGPYGVGFAMGTLGWGPGIALYTVFGFMAGYSGYLLWKAFLGLDSYEFPVRNYGDLVFRIYGPYARYFVNVLQALLLLLILGQVIILEGQGISQVSKFRLCYSVCCVLFVIVGYFIGQVRTLRNYGWLANTAVWINLLVIFITMGVMAHSPPNYEISVLGSAGGAVDPATITPDPRTGIYPAIIHYNGNPNPHSLIGSINGLLQGVFAYGGAQLFIEFMAEMKRPHDFIKAMWGAQFFIYAVYLVYGCYVYYFQGQYAYQVSYQGVSLYGFQVVGDMLACVSGLIAAGLYGNIGIKVFYNNVLMDILKAPPLTQRKGKILWMIIVPVWWSIAYVVAAAIPDYFGFVSVISATTVIQFTYSFPPILALGYNIKLYAMKTSAGDGFDPTTGTVTRQDTGIRRWMRGLIKGPWHWNILHVLYAIGALATAGLGLYAAIEGMIVAFEIPQVNAFTCVSPLDLSAQGS